MSDAKTNLDRLIEAYPEARGVGHVNLRNMTIAERAKFYELYQQAVGEIVWMLPSSGGENTLPNDVSDAEYWLVEAMTNTTTVMLDLLAGLRDTVEVE